jgi:ubiquinone/menaquinone biosynthesis C-methylase UbiE
VIPEWLLDRLACPVCLEGAGCALCERTEAGHSSCASEYAARTRCCCGGPDKVRLVAEVRVLVCPCCRATYPLRSTEGFVDIVPPGSAGNSTLYADHEFQDRMRVVDSAPYLSARVKADVMRAMVGPKPGEAIVDLGCGAGKIALYVASSGARVAGLDVAPFFLPRAASSLGLVRADLRRLPFRRSSFDGAYSLDVLEHLEEDAIVETLSEIRRILGEGGRLFVYTHTLDARGPLARFQRAMKALAGRLGEAGALDYDRERLRKSDHRNAITTDAHFDTLCRAAGLRVAQRRYYNVFFKPLIEDVLFRVYERLRDRLRSQRRSEGSIGASASGAASRLGSRPPGRIVIAVASLLTWLLKLDVVLFGGIRTGPFFARIEPVAVEPPGRAPKD